MKTQIEKVTDKNMGKGMITMRAYPAGTLAKISALRAIGNHAEAQKLFSQGQIVAQNKNLIMDGTFTGKQIILAILGNNSSYTGTGHISFGELGTGSTTPATSDTALTTPQSRAAVTYTTYSGDTVSFQFFFTDALLPNGTYTEFGSFVDGSSTIGSGNIFNHALFGAPYTKAAGTDITCQFDYTLS